MKKFILLLIFLLSASALFAEDTPPAESDNVGKFFHARINIGFAVDFTGTPGRIADFYDGMDWEKQMRNYFGATAGIDFDWRIFQKSEGDGAGELYMGFGSSFQYWTPTAYFMDYDDRAGIHYMRVPVTLNFHYDFKVNSGKLRRVGPEFSFGINNNLFLLRYKGEKDLYKEMEESLRFHQLSFTWSLGINLIFANNCFIALSVGGDKGSEQLKDYLFDENAGRFLYGHHEFLMFETGYRF